MMGAPRASGHQRLSLGPNVTLLRASACGGPRPNTLLNARATFVSTAAAPSHRPQAIPSLNCSA